MEITNYGDISPRTAGYATRKLLDRGQHLMVLERFGQVDPQGKNKTKTRKYRRYNSLARATAPLAEGISPAGQRLTFTDVNCNLEQFGDVVWITDVIIDTHEDPVLDEATKLCSEQSAETIEVIRYNGLKAGTNVFFPGTATTRLTVNGTISNSMLRKVYRTFKRNKAREISEIIKASGAISTEPVAPAFFALGHTDLLPDIKNLAGFVPVEQYSNSDKALPGEVGKVDQFRFILTALFEPFLAAGVAGTTYLSGGSAVSEATACDVYPVLFLGKDAYGMVPMQGQNAIEIGVVNPKKTTDDPLGQRGLVSWKTWQGIVILNQLFMARGEVACTANP
jgi:N4-gp56 family major capsid protein